MVTESPAHEGRLADAEADGEPTADQPRIKRRRVRVRRKPEKKFPKPVRMAILIVVPILLWTAIYFLGRAVL